MACGIPGQDKIISGMRGSAEVICEVNAIAAMYNKVPFFISPHNQVILSPGVGDNGVIPPEFLRVVFDAKTKGILHEAPIKYLCVYDLECNCAPQDKKHEIVFNEIIEFPVVVLDLEKME